MFKIFLAAIVLRNHYFKAFIFFVFASIEIYSQTIFINQSGYKIDGYKAFYTNAETLNYSIYRVDNNSVVNQGILLTTIENDAATGLTLSKGEFSDFNTEGIYYIKISDSLRSDTFSISPNVYEDVLYKTIKGYYFWRCGMELTDQYAGAYKHPGCHLTDGLYHSTTGLSGSKNAGGGWHDAGDYGKYVVNSGISTGTLLMAYEIFPNFFSLDDLNIPESGNGIPDILDEIKYQLEWMLTMQNDDGGVFHKVSTTYFPGFIMPQNDNGSRYIYQVSSTSTADFAAVMAKAYRVFKSFDTTFANRCLNAAEAGAEFLQNNPGIVPPGGFQNPPGTSTGVYGDNNDSDERLWAYCELYVSTNNEDYLNKYTALLSNPFNDEMGWRSVAQMGNISYLFLVNPGDENIKTTLRNALTDYSDNLVFYTQGDGFNAAIKPGEYVWGSNSNILNNAILLILAYKLTNNEEYLRTAQDQFNYVLGTNAHNISFVTGVGKRYPLYIHHRPSAADNITEPVPGYIAGGPNQYLGDPILQSNFTSSTPPALCYIDHLDSYASNEVCLNWNAPLVFVAGYFNAKDYSVGIEMEVANKQSAGFILYQNYPNPFNPITKIKYKIPAIKGETLVTLKVYDILGREIETLINEEKEAGEYEVEFDVFALTSGVYFYRLTANEFSTSHKMIIVK